MYLNKPDPILSTLLFVNSSKLILTTMASGGCDYDFHFKDVLTEAQRTKSFAQGHIGSKRWSQDSNPTAYLQSLCSRESGREWLKGSKDKAGKTFWVGSIHQITKRDSSADDGS